MPNNFQTSPLHVAGLFLKKSSASDAVEKILLEIPEKDHITTLEKPFTGITPQKQPIHFKPNGLWYSCGREWIEWVRNESRFTSKYIYRLHINYSRVLKITNEKDFDEFSEEYVAKNKILEMNTTMYVDWPKVSVKYGGVEICPYLHTRRRSKKSEWYYWWDVASGCLWDPSTVSGADLLYVYNETTDSYDKQGV
jgi:hypothetical protein